MWLLYGIRGKMGNLSVGLKKDTENDQNLDQMDSLTER